MMKYGEISHFSHPNHKLKFDFTDIPFKCDGCKEIGVGSRYHCPCDFDLHAHCALPFSSAAPLTHPFYKKCSFEFLSRPPGKSPRYCNACEKDVAGFVYHCRECGFDLHPCCAMLPMALDDGELKLYLYRKVSSPCLRCGRKGRSWSYRSSCKKYNIHVACVREMLVENWRELYNGQNGKSAGGRIPSLKNTHQHRHRSKGKVHKCCEIAGIAVQFVISAVLGDPTAIIAGVIGSLISRA
ncbi:PREDICTED: uncharacterized protein LOC104804360 [Tarenaya hassleriana]|uniref:uncharacterized protein LOC104804360 n=1 Tax=Tarenaya hassleriana TaxID=28532 RepID=UPI00053C1DC7|nr:PREDICTED: uncharacterized protein LOC104804360 [Tarenaya hassleriana]XP_010526930.1 PREDICTED: uncharacterized protein LOC104804360 [Tarenaya hassleriana]XP_010526931.1 PREDICTED: uncharacterized protein LOC104804360 [Tarenaya hassleriana]XP_010526932.1 PREDICTED: uncharacterized protein LOC104804360 [Tarenaya hassleriana]